MTQMLIFSQQQHLLIARIKFVRLANYLIFFWILSKVMLYNHAELMWKKRCWKISGCAFLTKIVYCLKIRIITNIQFSIQINESTKNFRIVFENYVVLKIAMFWHKRIDWNTKWTNSFVEKMCLERSNNSLLCNIYNGYNWPGPYIFRLRQRSPFLPIQHTYDTTHFCE